MLLLNSDWVRRRVLCGGSIWRCCEKENKWIKSIILSQYSTLHCNPTHVLQDMKRKKRVEEKQNGLDGYEIQFKKDNSKTRKIFKFLKYFSQSLWLSVSSNSEFLLFSAKYLNGNKIILHKFPYKWQGITLSKLKRSMSKAELEFEIFDKFLIGRTSWKEINCWDRNRRGAFYSKEMADRWLNIFQFKLPSSSMQAQIFLLLSNALI